MSLNESMRHSREFMLKAVERLEAGERASALAIELNLQRTIIYHWRDRLRANGAEALTSNRGRPRTPEVLAAEGLRASRARADGLVQARAQIAELERKVGQQQLDLDFFRAALRHIEGSRQPSDGSGVTASSPTSRQ
ncbi:MAG: helix-turn-helix domain-containing protein [Janthinobacterium lividum]